MSRVQAVLLLAGPPKGLEYVSEQQDVGAAVHVAVVPQGLAPKGLPNLLRMGVVLVTDMPIRELAVEDLLQGEFGLGESIPGVPVLVRVHTLPD